jgi:hypothetical protein
MDIDEHREDARLDVAFGIELSDDRAEHRLIQFRELKKRLKERCALSAVHAPTPTSGHPVGANDPSTPHFIGPSGHLCNHVRQHTAQFLGS